MTSDEKGYIQFTCEWDRTSGVAYDRLPEIIRWRRRLVQERLVGVDANGVGFGNISERIDGTDTFIITATQTGHLSELDASHFAVVTKFDIPGNWVRCGGAIRASSESLSHAALYQSDPKLGAVVHVHDAESWHRLLGRAPTTDPAAEAGTVAMADAIRRIVSSSGLPKRGFLVMGGHKDGLLSFGQDIAEAASIMLSNCGRRVPDEHAAFSAM